MTLESTEQKAALEFYVAFGNLQRDPESPTLLQRYFVARNDLLNVAGPPSRIVRTLQDIADLRHLLSIAVWIRSDQLGHPNSVRLVSAGSWEATVPPIKVNTHALSLRNCQGDLDHGLEWWKRFAEILDKQRFKGHHSWFVSDFPDNGGPRGPNYEAK